jgi:hypothetical protein
MSERWPKPEWCVEAFYRVNPGATTTVPRIPSLYLLDFACEVLRAQHAHSPAASPSVQPETALTGENERLLVEWIEQLGEDGHARDLCRRWSYDQSDSPPGWRYDPSFECSCGRDKLLVRVSRTSSGLPTKSETGNG